MTDVRNAPDFEEMYARGKVSTIQDQLDLERKKADDALYLLKLFLSGSTLDRANEYLLELQESVTRMVSLKSELEEWYPKAFPNK